MSARHLMLLASLLLSACSDSLLVAKVGGDDTGSASTLTLCVEGDDGTWTVQDTTAAEAEALIESGQALLPGSFFLDADADGHGDPSAPLQCPQDGSVSNGDDCDDTRDDVHPGVEDASCDAVDDDCDGESDEDYLPVETSCGAGECAAIGETYCEAGDEQDSCAPGAEQEEICDGLDNDCDGSVMGGEELCQDGNADNGDGCSDVCLPEDCYDGALQSPASPVDCEVVTTTIQGPSAVRDASIIGPSDTSYWTTNHGWRDSLDAVALEWSAYWRGDFLIRFDVSSIPTDAVVQYARLQLYAHAECSAVGSDPTACGSLDPGTWSADVTELQRTWVESEVTFRNATASTAWSSVGASTNGSDRRTGGAGSFAGLNSLVTDSFIEADLTASVAALVSAERANHGWIVEPPATAHYEARALNVRSTEYVSETCEERPTLVVEWVAAGCR
jgi:hypothetical protein